MTIFPIRLAVPDDMDGIAALFDAYRQFYGHAPNLGIATQFMTHRLTRQDSVILIAPTDAPSQAFAGFCQMYPTFCSVEAAPIYALYDLYVAPFARKMGVGRSLLLAAEAHARKEGYARMDLTTAKTNHAAQSLYESLGWVRDTVFYAYSRTLG